MADDDSSLLKEDGYLNIDAECRSIIYHPNLNVLLITTSNAQVYVFDVNFGVILQRSIISGIIFVTIFIIFNLFSNPNSLYHCSLVSCILILLCIT